MACIYKARRGPKFREEPFVDDVIKCLQLHGAGKHLTRLLPEGYKEVFCSHPQGSSWPLEPQFRVYDTPMGAGSSVVRVDLLGIVDWYFCETTYDLHDLMTELTP